MKNVYDMVTGEFIVDEPTITSGNLSDDGYRENHLVQLQLVTVESLDKDVRMPADLAYRIFFND